MIQSTSFSFDVVTVEDTTKQTRHVHSAGEIKCHDKGAWVQVKAGRHYNNSSKP